MTLVRLVPAVYTHPLEAWRTPMGGETVTFPRETPYGRYESWGLILTREGKIIGTSGGDTWGTAEAAEKCALSLCSDLAGKAGALYLIDYVRSAAAGSGRLDIEQTYQGLLEMILGANHTAAQRESFEGALDICVGTDAPLPNAYPNFMEAFCASVKLEPAQRITGLPA